jgi:PAS domain S-box-containing protein
MNVVTHSMAGSGETDPDLGQATATAVRMLKLSHLTIEHAPDMILWLSADGRVRRANHAASALLGYVGSELLELRVEDIIERDAGDGWPAFVAAGHPPIQVETRLRTRGGEHIPVDVSIAALNVEGEALNCAIARDITARKAAELALRNALTELEQLKNRLQAENVYLRQEITHEQSFGEVVGKSPALLSVLRKVQQVAATNATVLVLGESGTGKELIARAVHDSSPRKERALVKVNCAALPATLIESELFGHEKGAFTGALARRIGRFELAHEGTLFLDEIGDLPLELQAKLLRVLQEGELERLGDPKTIHVDVRVIAATNQNLEDAVAAGRFRADLYYRLNVFPVTLPPLRERDDDVILLAEFFAVQSGRKLGKRVEGIAPPLRERLRSYPWPGNVRELQNVIERAVIITDAPLLAFDEPFRGPINGPSLAAAVAGRMTPVQSVASIARAAAPDPAAGGAPATLHEVEINMMRAALEACNWVVGGKQGAAARLGLPASTLRERMARYGLRKGA